MVALVYLLPPVSGLVGLGMARGPVVRTHALQAIAFGTLWPLLLLGAATLSETATRAVWGGGTLLWLGLGLVALVRPRLALPVAKRLAGWGELRASVRDEPRNTSGT